LTGGDKSLLEKSNIYLPLSLRGMDAPGVTGVHRAGSNPPLLLQKLKPLESCQKILFVGQFLFENAKFGTESSTIWKNVGTKLKF